jgi:oxygen-independent coproporphyrinogen-3 oxidase
VGFVYKPQVNNYFGAGAGAVGFLKNRRYYPQTDIDAYIADPLKIKEEYLTADELLTEKIFLGLRSDIGVKKALLTSAMRSRAEELLNEKLTFTNGTYYNMDFFLADEIALYLLD